MLMAYIDENENWPDLSGLASQHSVVELPGIETDALPGNLPADLPIRSVSFRFSPARYLRIPFRDLTASRLDHRGSEPCTRRLRRQGRLDIGQPGAKPVGNYHDSPPRRQRGHLVTIRRPCAKWKSDIDLMGRTVDNNPTVGRTTKLPGTQRIDGWK
jgi:hypothetical protein